MSDLREPSFDERLAGDPGRDEARSATRSSGLAGESRLLLVLPGELPGEVVSALQQSPLTVEEVGANLLGSGPLLAADTILVGDVRRLGLVVDALEKRKALNTRIIAIGHPSRLQLDEERLKDLKLTVFPRSWNAGQVVRRTVQLVVQHLRSRAANTDAQVPAPSASPLAAQSRRKALSAGRTVQARAAVPETKQPAKQEAANSIERKVGTKRPTNDRAADKPSGQSASVASPAVSKSAAGSALRSPAVKKTKVRAAVVAKKAKSLAEAPPVSPVTQAKGTLAQEVSDIKGAGPAAAGPQASDPAGRAPRAESVSRIATSTRGPRPVRDKSATLSGENKPLPASAAPSAVEAKLANTPSTKLSLKAPPELQALAARTPQVELRYVTSDPTPSDLKPSDSIPHAPPSSHRHRLARFSPGLDADSGPQSKEPYSARPASMAPDGRTLRATRWVVVDDDDVRIQAVATCLRQLGAKVETLSLTQAEARLNEVRQLDAIGYIIDERDVPRASELMTVFEADSRLRWMRLISLRWGEVFDEATNGVVLETLTRCLELHWETEWEALEELMQGIEVRVSRLGMARILLAAGKASGTRALRVSSLEHDYVLSLESGSVIVVGRDGKAVQAQDLPELFRELMDLREASAILESESQLQSAPLASLRDLLREHARALEGSMFGGRSWQVPAVRVAKRLELPRLRSGVASFLAPKAKGAIRKIRDYRLPIGAGLAALTVALLVVASVRGVKDGQAQEMVVHSVQSTATERTAEQKKTSAKAEPRASAKAAQEPEPLEAPTPPPAVGSSAARSEASQAPSGNKLQIPNKSCERLLTRTTVPAGRNVAQAKSAWRLARKSLLRGEVELAEERLCLSSHLNPEGQGVVDLIRFYFTQNDVAAAKVAAEWALTVRAADPSIKQLLADALNAQGQTAGARNLLMDSMNLGENDRELLARVSRRFANAGHKARRGGDPTQAERLFRRAMSLDETNLLGATGLAELALKNDSFADAEHWARRAVELEPRSFRAQFALGEVLAQNGKKSDARSAFRVALRLNPGSSIVRKRLGL